MNIKIMPRMKDELIIEWENPSYVARLNVKCKKKEWRDKYSTGFFLIFLIYLFLKLCVCFRFYFESLIHIGISKITTKLTAIQFQRFLHTINLFFRSYKCLPIKLDLIACKLSLFQWMDISFFYSFDDIFFYSFDEKISLILEVYWIT